MLPSDLKLPAELEARVEAAAQASGKAPRDILVEAVEAYFAGVTEDRTSFVSEALAAREEFERTGLAYDADDVFDYLLERAKGNNPAQPTIKQWSA
jgi:predicted transcriptional regulator